MPQRTQVKQQNKTIAFLEIENVFYVTFRILDMSLTKPQYRQKGGIA